MSVFSDIVRRVTGRGVGENIGRAIGGYIGGPAGVAIGQQVGGSLSEELARNSRPPEPTTMATVPSDMGPVMPTGPATNIEIDFRGDSDMPMQGMGLTQSVQRYNDPRIQQANVIPFVRPLAGPAAGLVGGATAFVMDLFTGQPTKLIITRKLQRDAKMAAEFYMNDLDMVAEYLSRTKGKRFTEDIVVDILLKKFTNQGPYVTKAAVRKTRSTIRKLNTLCKLEAEICKPRRRAPARRASTATARAMAKA